MKHKLSKNRINWAKMIPVLIVALVLSITGTFAYLRDEEGTINKFVLGRSMFKTSLTVQKVWDDQDNYLSQRPDSITVLLCKNNNETDKTVTLSDQNDWVATFDSLAKFDDDGNTIHYSVKEIDKVPGYKTSYNIENDKTTITNKTEIKEEDESATLYIKKQRTGSDINVEGAIFDLLDSDMNPIAEAATNKEGIATFRIKPNSDDDYTLTLIERTAPSGYTATSEKWVVNMQKSKTPEVTVNDESMLAVWKWDATINSASYDSDSHTLNVTNDYDVETKSIQFEGTKDLSGLKLEDNMFTFSVEEGDVNIASGYTKADGTIEFTPIAYTLEDVGTHTYTIYENNNHLGGIKYDTSVFTIEVEVTDNGDGTLNAVIENKPIIFNNIYTAKSVSKSFQGTKILDGTKTLEENMFSFFIVETDKDGEEGENERQIVKNSEDGSIVFPEITWTKEGTYYYKIGEVKEDEPGVDYDDTEYTVTVTITDNKKGQLVAEVQYPENGIVFNNSYAAEPCQLVIEGLKTLDGKSEIPQFSFEVLEGENVVATGTNEPDGEITFTPISYSAEGTHDYIVREIDDGQTGIVYDDSEQELHITVTDKDAVLVAEGDETVSFNNTYSPQSVIVMLRGTKTLKGRDLQGRDFSFVATENGEQVSEATNDADGNISFTPIVYDEAGTHEIIVKEVKESSSNVTYDETEYTVTIDVEDNGNGKLIANIKSDDISFVNTYHKSIKPATIAVTGKKVLKGKKLKDGMFGFELKDSKGNVVSKAVNKANGSITFDSLKFKKAGIYRYKVSEIKGTKRGFTYDKSVYNVKIVVKETPGGDLCAKVKSNKNIVFTNSYKKIEDEDSGKGKKKERTYRRSGSPSGSSGVTRSTGSYSPGKSDGGDKRSGKSQTSDPTRMIILLGLFMILATASVDVIILKKRRNRSNEN